MQSEEGKPDILCFRHARSKFNEGEQQYDYKKGSFDSQVLYNPIYIDTHLSSHGIKQCQEAKNRKDLSHVNVVLVSPLNRALQTANIVFGDREIPIIVHAQLTQSFRYSCDISCPFEQKLKQFPKFDFSNVKDKNQNWEIRRLSLRNQQLYDKFMHKHKQCTLNEQQHRLCQLLAGQEFKQNNEELRRRAGIIKQLLQQYKKKYKTIAVVSHWWTISFLIAQGYNNKCSPKRWVDVENATPYWVHLAKLLKYK